MAWAVACIILISTFIEQFNCKVLYFVGKNFTQNITIVEIGVKMLQIHQLWGFIAYYVFDRVI